MPLEHVQAEEHVHRLLTQHRKARGQMVILDLQLDHVNPAQNGLGADALGHAIPARVDQSVDVTAFGAVLAHDCRLGARVHEGLDRHSVHLAVDITGKEEGDPLEVMRVLRGKS